MSQSASGLTGELDVRSFDHGLELHALYLLGRLDPSAVVGKSVVGLLRSCDRADVALVIACGDVDRCADWQGAAWREWWHRPGSLAPPFCAARWNPPTPRTLKSREARAPVAVLDRRAAWIDPGGARGVNFIRTCAG